LSFLHGQSGEVPLAKAAVTRAQELGPDLAETHMALGYYSYYGSRDYEHALKEFTVVRERQPNDPDVIGTIGFVLRRQGRWDDAVRDMSRAVELDPRNHTLLLNLGEGYLRLRRYPEADRVLEQAIALAPDIPFYHAGRAYLHLMDGKIGEARQVLAEAASRVDPARILLGVSAVRYPALVRLFAVEHRDAIARLTLRAAEGDTIGYYWLKAEYRRAIGDPAGTRAALDSARVILEPKVAARRANTEMGQNPVEEFLALIYAREGRKAAAIQLGREGVQRLPASRDAVAGPAWLQWLVEVYVETGEYDAAVGELERLLSIPSLVSVPLLRVDPLFAPLKANPRFERLVRVKP
jgi:tetratricopeptide (TPR) repeat protein